MKPADQNGYAHRFCVRMTRPTMKRLWAVAQAEGITRSDVMKKALENYLDEYEALNSDPIQSVDFTQLAGVDFSLNMKQLDDLTAAFNRRTSK
jgi:hypothetical protein